MPYVHDVEMCPLNLSLAQPAAHRTHVYFNTHIYHSVNSTLDTETNPSYKNPVRLKDSQIANYSKTAIAIP